LALSTVFASDPVKSSFGQRRRVGRPARRQGRQLGGRVREDLDALVHARLGKLRAGLDRRDDRAEPTPPAAVARRRDPGVGVRIPAPNPSTMYQSHSGLRRSSGLSVCGAPYGLPAGCPRRRSSRFAAAMRI
jgi:hypothetical protein